MTLDDGTWYPRIPESRFQELFADLVAEEIPELRLYHLPLERTVCLVIQRDTFGTFCLTYRDGPGSPYTEAESTSQEEVYAAALAWARRDAGWGRAFGWEAESRKDPEPAPGLPEAVREEVEEALKALLVAGYATPDHLADVAADHPVPDGAGPVSAEQARDLVERLWWERLDEQAGWGEEPTDPDRLTAAFSRLEERGIAAREQFSCCRPCGVSELRAERPEGARGFVFFHDQCLAGVSASSPTALPLYYSSYPGSEEAAAAVGGEVVAALHEAGLATEWDGDPGRAILVTPVTWRKRLVGFPGDRRHV